MVWECQEVPSAGWVLAGEARVAPASVVQGRRGCKWGPGKYPGQVGGM